MDSSTEPAFVAAGTVRRSARMLPTRPVRSTLARRLGLALVLAAAGGSSCARRSEEAARAAWEQAVRAGRGDGGDGGDGGGRGGGDGGREGASWQALRKVVDEVEGTLALGVPTVDLEGLAARLCGAAPELSREDAGLVYHCDPDPPIVVQGVELQVEVDATGVVGFAAPDVDGAVSESLLQRALEHFGSACAHSWTPVQRGENAHEEFFTCPTASGTVIAIGRFPRDLAGNRWHFSLALLGPG